MQNYTPSPAPLPSTISLPQDAVDVVVVSTVRTSIEPIADAVAFAQGGRVARLSFNAGAVAAGGTVVPITMQASYPSGAWLASSNEVQVPSAGLYLISGRSQLTSSSPVDNVECQVDIEIAGSQCGVLVGNRTGTSTSTTTTIYGFTVVYVSTPASEKLRFTQKSSSVLTFSSNGAYFKPITIVYLGKPT